MQAPDLIANFSVELLDQVVSALYSGQASQEVQQMLIMFQEHPDAWTRVDAILETAQNPNTKILALSVLDACTKTRWRTLPMEQREGIKSYLIGLVIKLSSNDVLLKEHAALLKRLNRSIVQILKQDWPQNWPSFIPDLVTASKSNDSLCTNNMHILQLLSEEVFDFSNAEMTQEKMRDMKHSLNKEFSLIFELCFHHLENSSNATLLSVTLETLLRFLSWIPIGYIMETSLIEILALKFFPAAAFQNITLQCLVEVSNLTFADHPNLHEYNVKFAQMFLSIIGHVSTMLQPEINLADAFRTGSPSVQEFVRHLSLFITIFCRNHLGLLENGDDSTRNAISSALSFLLRISTVDDDSIFKICLEYWIGLVTELYNSNRALPVQPLLLGRAINKSPRLMFYAPLLSQLRLVLIQRMARPEEVLVVEDENGEIVRENMKDTDAINLYKSMRECLVYLTNLDAQDTQEIILSKLAKQMDGSEYSWNNLNTLCWAVGSISGALTEDQEKNFVVHVIKALLELCDRKRGKDHKAVIASNILYVVGQYPRFLRLHWRFLKTVVNKLFEFMHEKHPGVQDMACDTFLKIAKKCRRKFVVRQDDADPRPYIEDMLEQLPITIQDLEPGQVQTYYEAMGHIIQSQTDPAKRQALIYKLMELPNKSWTAIVTQATSDMASLVDPKTIKSVTSILKTNVRVASAVGPGYIVQLGRIYVEMLQIYKVYSEFISNECATKGVSATAHSIVRNMRTVKKEVIKLIEVFVESSQPADQESIISSFLPELLDPLLGDYLRGVPSARESVVLSLFATIINKLGSNILDIVPRVFEATFQCTLEMITANFEDFPDHRLHFFNLLRAINSKCFRAFFMVSPDQFKLVIDSIVWAFKHIERNIADTGLNILYELLGNIENSEIANQFYQTYYLSLLQDLFAVLTDTLHKPGFKMHSTLLAKMFGIVENGSVTVPLFDPSTAAFPNNASFLRSFVVNLLASAFTNLTQHDVERFVQGLFALNANLEAFKMHLRDFLIQLKEFSATGDNNADLFREESEAQASAQRQAEQERILAVPGLMYRSKAGEEATFSGFSASEDLDDD